MRSPPPPRNARTTGPERHPCNAHCKRVHNGLVRPSVTLRDVARAAQVHPGTVSRALNVETRGLVNEETAERVIRAAEELGYRPNPIARGLKTNRSFTVGVLIPDLTNPLFPPIVRGIEDRLGAAGYTSLIANTDNDPDRERQDFEAMRARQVDGFITATARLDEDFVIETESVAQPIVLVNRRLEDESLPAVTADDFAGARLAVEHVAGLGHRRIAHLGGPQAVSTGRRRRRGFLEAMAGAGLEVDERTVRFASAFTEAEGARVCRDLLDAAPGITAIVAGNDLLALGCFDVLSERGLRCPDDVSVVGFNDMPFADRFDPPLTTVRIPHREIGAAAADLLLERLSDGDSAPRQLMLAPSFTVRRSTAPPAAGRVGA
jgi:LacI family transcriptional regulator